MIRAISIVMALVTGVLGVSAEAAVEGVRCSLEIHQRSEDSARWVLLWQDTTTLVTGLRKQGFPLAFSVDLSLESADTSEAIFSVHVVTLTQPPRNYARRYRVEYGLPAELAPIAGKNDVRYRLRVIPLGPVTVDTTGCAYLHTRSEDFRADPSAHLNIYFVPQTLGDFHWNAVKGLMEDAYERFDKLNRFTLPGKYALYLCPCPVPSVLWDHRFTMMVDPTRNAAFTVYNPDFNSADPFAVTYAATLRNYGYAPPFLAEGFANFLSLSTYDMQKFFARGDTVRLDDFLDTHAYLKADPVLADRVASSFVKYLVNTFKVDRFLEAYRLADDLNLRSVLEAVYGLSLAELESGWRRYLDTVTLSDERLSWGADVAETMRQFRRSLELLQTLWSRAATRNDSLRAVGRLARMYFFLGDYSRAAEYERILVGMDSSYALWYMTLAGYEMMDGRYDSALAHLQMAHARDTASDMIRFNLALAHLYAGDRSEGLRRLRDLVAAPIDGSTQVESRILLAVELADGGGKQDREDAYRLFDEALALLERQGPPPVPSATRRLWLAIANLGLGDTGEAGDHLSTALYLESRAFYRGMIFLWLGKLADILDQHDAAREYYRLVLDHPSAAYHKAEAKKYLDTPFRW